MYKNVLVMDKCTRKPHWNIKQCEYHPFNNE